MIKTFRHKELAKLWSGGRSKIDKRLHGRVLERLDAMNAAERPDDLNVPGYDFHGLQKRYSIRVNGPWCITFEFEGGDAYRVDIEQYH
jgi:proteic killer suppression protein